MPGKNFIVRMADRLRAGNAGKAASERDAAHDFLSRQHILAALAARLKSKIDAEPRFAGVSATVRPSIDAPERIQLRCRERIVTIRIAPGSEYFIVGGSGLGKRFSANPAHMQSDDVVLLYADEAASVQYGTEITALDILKDLAEDRSS